MWHQAGGRGEVLSRLRNAGGCTERTEQWSRCLGGVGVPEVSQPSSDNSPHLKRSLIIAAVACAVVVVCIAIFALTRISGGSNYSGAVATSSSNTPAKDSGSNGKPNSKGGSDATAAGADGLGNSVTNISVGKGMAVSANGKDYFIGENGIECSNVGEKGKVKEIYDLSDNRYTGMLNYADGRLFFVTYDQDSEDYEIVSIKTDGSDEEELYSTDSYPYLSVSDGNVRVIYTTYRKVSALKGIDTMHVVTMKSDGSDALEVTNFDMDTSVGHAFAMTKDRVFYTDEAAETSTGSDTLYSMNFDGSGKTKLYEANGGPVENICVVGDRVLFEAGDSDRPNSSEGTWDHYVISMNQDGSDLKKIVSTADQVEIIGANKDTVYIKVGDDCASYSAKSGDKTKVSLQKDYKDKSFLFGMDDHVVITNSNEGNADSVGSMKPDGSNYVRYTKKK